MRWLWLCAFALTASCGKTYDASIDCSDQRRGMRSSERTSGEDDGFLITEEMLECAGQANDLPSDTVDFVLTLGGGLGEGVQRPPHQRIRVPVRLVDRLHPTAVAARGEIRAGSVTLHVPFVDNGFAPSSETGPRVPVSLSITGEGWQQRARLGADPELGALPNYVRRTTEFGLYAIVARDPSRHSNLYEQQYVAIDDELGFIKVVCFGFPERGPRSCRITSELSKYLIVDVQLPEDQLTSWRALTMSARAFARTLVV
jgi:hypothetical protein